MTDDTPTCNAPDCNESLDSVHARTIGFCGDVCRNVSLKVGAETVQKGDITESLPEERVAEIRENTEATHQKLLDELDE